MDEREWSIRDEAADGREIAAIRAVHRAAFADPNEAALVDDLREAGKAVVSLVAVRADGHVVGHVLFSPVTVDGLAPGRRALGLAPVGVHPDRQGRGIGSALCERGLEVCRSLGIDAVVVLGHADYYPRFGFRAASTFGLRCAYDVPPELFMACELTPDALRDAAGVVHYADEFARFDV